MQNKGKSKSKGIGRSIFRKIPRFMGGNTVIQNSRKGFTMVEAAIIYPLIIGAVMAVIYIIICMYTGAAMKASVDIELRNRALEITETGEKFHFAGKFTPEDKYGGGAFNTKVFLSEKKINGEKIVFGQASHTYSGNAMMAENVARTHQGTVYLIDERDYIRKTDILF